MEDMRRQEVRELARLTATLTAAQQAFFQGEYGRHRRNPTTALLLCLLLGGFGAHYFYFGRHRAGLLRLVLSWTLVPAVMALFEARTIGARAIRYNASLANELLLAMSDTVHHQPREVDALETLSTPMALPASGRAALYTPDEHDITADTAEAALIAAAYAGRESAHAAAAAPNGATNGHSGLAYSNGAPANGTSLPDSLSGAAAHPQLPASEYDMWYDHALHAVPVAATDGHANGALAEPATAVGPDAPQWVPLPEWPTPHSRALRAVPADDWSMPDLDHQDGSAAPAHPQIAATDLLGGTSFNVGLAGDLADRPNPGIAAAAAGAAAAWAEHERPAPAGESDTPARADREPVFLYQAAPAARRPAVHYGPPPPPASGDWAQPGEGAPSLPRRLGEDAGLASLGSLLAAGLADLLRERPAPLRTRPLTQPPAAQSAVLAAPDSARRPSVSAPLPSPSLDPEDPWAVSASIRAPLAESPHLLPVPDDLTGAPEVDASAAIQHDWLALGAASGLATGGATLAADRLWAHEGAHLAVSDAPAWSSESPAAAETDALARIAESELEPAWQPAPAPVATPEAYVTTPSQGLRRRITHRLFVRKMAVLEGRVVAESSVERQVELIDDDAIMAERVRQATESAAREALENLLQLAPPEAVPAVRAQLRSLDLQAN
jgi:TM2 domain-containing membrane protein YozV